jgi:hypothetical protein
MIGKTELNNYWIKQFHDKHEVLGGTNLPIFSYISHLFEVFETHLVELDLVDFL